MSPFDTFMFDWFGDTLFNVLLFNIVLVGPGVLRSRAGAWRAPGGRGRRSSLYTALLSAALRFFDYALAGGELWSAGGLSARLGCAIRHRRRSPTA